MITGGTGILESALVRRFGKAEAKITICNTVSIDQVI